MHRPTQSARERLAVQCPDASRFRFSNYSGMFTPFLCVHSVCMRLNEVNLAQSGTSI